MMIVAAVAWLVLGAVTGNLIDIAISQIWVAGLLLLEAKEYQMYRFLFIIALLFATPLYADQVTDYIAAHPDVVCYGGTGQCTLAYCPPYVDKNGWHYPQCNTCNYFYQCTDGHTITISQPAGGIGNMRTQVQEIKYGEFNKNDNFDLKISK